MKKILLIVLPIVLLAGGAGVYFLVLKKPAPVPAAGAAAAAEPFSGPPGLVTMDTFLVNIADASGDRFAKVELRLTVVPAKTAEEINADPLLMARMRDRILTLLTSKSYEELSTPLGKEGFRREVKARLAPLVDTGEVQDVLFQDFMVQ